MPQKDNLLPWRRALGNAILGAEIGGVPRARPRRGPRPLFDRFGLAGFEQAWPSQLSGGMRQRLALLRTFLLDRPVLLLDEPFGALDAITRRSMQAWLQDVWLGRPAHRGVRHPRRRGGARAGRPGGRAVAAARPGRGRRRRRPRRAPRPRPHHRPGVRGPQAELLERSPPDPGPAVRPTVAGRERPHWRRGRRRRAGRPVRRPTSCSSGSRTSSATPSGSRSSTGPTGSTTADGRRPGLVGRPPGPDRPARPVEAAAHGPHPARRDPGGDVRARRARRPLTTRPGCCRPTWPPSNGGSLLTMRLHYGGALFGPVLERLLRDEIERSRERLLDRVAGR